MQALVTGATGFLGRYVVELLAARGARVRALVRRDDADLASLGVELCRGDVRDADAVAAAADGVDTVFHTAAIAGIWGRRSEFFDVNVLGTRHVLTACRRHGVGRLVYTSSPSVTFDGSPQCGVDERAPYPKHWMADYPRTKAEAEREVLAAHRPGKLATCALRPHLIWGPRDRHLIPRLIARAKAGQLRRVGDGKNLIDIIYVTNAADAHLLAAEALGSDGRGPAGGRAYFLSQGEPVGCWPWIDQLLELAGLPPVERSVSLGAAVAAGAMLEATWRLTGRTSEPRMTRFLAYQLGRAHYFNISAARRDLGYAPRVSTAEGMQRIAGEFRALATGAPSA